MDLGVRGRVAVVTASSKGLGLASAKALAADGASVLISSRSAEHLQRAAAEIAEVQDGGEVLTVEADMSDPDAPGRLVDAALERFGRVDIAVANNGGPPPSKGMEVTDQQILDAVNANQLASIRLVRAVVPHMRERGWGRICCITSASIKDPIPFLPLSNIARTGLWAWAKTTADELFADGITLNLACPGMHATERVTGLGADRGPLGDPDDFGAVVAFLCSDQARFMTGTAVMVDGGRSSGLL